MNTANLTPAVPAGVELTSYSIGGDGIIRGVFDDGIQRSMAQIAIADFTNPLGLEKVGDTAFRASANSGAVELGVAGQGSRGNLLSGSVGMSKVDQIGRASGRERVCQYV